MGGICCSKENRNDEVQVIRKKEEHARLVQVLEGHDGGINCLCVSEDGNIVATGSEDSTIRLWKLDTEDKNEKPMYVCIGVLHGHEKYITSMTMEEDFLYSGSSDMQVRKWKISSHSCVHVMSGHTSKITMLHLVEDGVTLVSASTDRSIRCWNRQDGTERQVFTGHSGTVGCLISMKSSPDLKRNITRWMDGKVPESDYYIVSGSGDTTARLWAVDQAKSVQRYQGHHESAVTCLLVDLPSLRLFTGCADMTAIMWELVTGKTLRVFSQHSGAIICMTIDNRILYTGSADHSVIAWAPDVGNPLRTFTGHKHSINSLRIHNGLLITTSGDYTIRIFCCKTATLKDVFSGHTLMVNTARIAKDSLISASHDGTARVWSIDGIRDEFAEEVQRKKQREEKAKLKVIEKMKAAKLKTEEDEKKRSMKDAVKKATASPKKEEGEDNEAMEAPKKEEENGKAESKGEENGDLKIIEGENIDEELEQMLSETNIPEITSDTDK